MTSLVFIKFVVGINEDNPLIYSAPLFLYGISEHILVLQTAHAHT